MDIGAGSGGIAVVAALAGARLSLAWEPDAKLHARARAVEAAVQAEANGTYMVLPVGESATAAVGHYPGKASSASLVVFVVGRKPTRIPRDFVKAMPAGSLLVTLTPLQGCHAGLAFVGKVDAAFELLGARPLHVYVSTSRGAERATWSSGFLQAGEPSIICFRSYPRKKEKCL